MQTETVIMKNRKQIFRGHCTPGSVYAQRRARFAQYLSEQELGAAVFFDSEERREPTIRYFTGFPSDAVLVITAGGDAVLIPWDIHLADMLADAEYIAAYTLYERDPVKAVYGACSMTKLASDSRIELPPETPYLQFLALVDSLSSFHVLCRRCGAHEYVREHMRAVKDEHEIALLRTAAQITDELIEQIETAVRGGVIQTEIDAALLIERECRRRGCEGTGFDSLVAGAERSFAIHCFPPYTNNPYPGDGLAILDFGVMWHGYTSDATLTFVSGNPSAQARRLISLVEKAYDAALDLYKPGNALCAPAQAVSTIFAKENMQMPHSLGHGIGLEVHEKPTVRQSAAEDQVFQPGMVVTLEPGLYLPQTGGCRYENDILITETGNEALTHSRIIYI